MGHKIRPRISPIALPPQVGIFLNDVRNVRVQQCVIEGFDFGIFAINSKRAPLETVKSLEIIFNTIKARYTGVTLMGVDKAEITSNDISYTRAGGSALYVGRNSDSNIVRYNTFFANLVPNDNMQAFRVPGPASPANLALPPISAGLRATPGSAVVITQIENSEPTLLNAFINGTLFQLRIPNSFDSSREFSEGNRFEANVIRFTTVPLPVDGLALAIPQGTTVINNRIEGGGDAAIRVGMQNEKDRVFPGTCSLPPHLLCLKDTMCPNPGFALVNRCTGLVSEKVTWISRDTLIEGNEILGPLGAGISTTGQRATIVNNTIVGPLRDARSGAGIRLVGKFALESSTVTRNSVSNAAVALGLIQEFQNAKPDSFGAQIRLNDFTGYSTAVLTTRVVPKPAEPPAAPVYDLLTDFSKTGPGNFWGTVSCLGLEADKVRNTENTSRNGSVTDSHPFNRSVAKALVLPQPCEVLFHP